MVAAAAFRRTVLYIRPYRNSSVTRSQQSVWKYQRQHESNIPKHRRIVQNRRQKDCVVVSMLLCAKRCFRVVIFNKVLSPLLLDYNFFSLLYISPYTLCCYILYRRSILIKNVLVKINFRFANLTILFIAKIIKIICESNYIKVELTFFWQNMCTPFMFLNKVYFISTKLLTKCLRSSETTIVYNLYIGMMISLTCD